MLGYYAHQHGNGHSNYAQIFAKASGYKIPIFTSGYFKFDPGVKVYHLPQEDPDGTETSQDIIPVPDYLHYSPVGQLSIQQRSAKLLQTVLDEGVKLMIVDLSVEMAALCRAASVPYAYVRLPGNRNDSGHLQAFQGATFLLAYYPKEVDSNEIPTWIKEKTIYLGFFDRFGSDERSTTAFSKEINTVAVISGKGGNENLKANLPKIFERFKDSRIDIYGLGLPNGQHDDNIRLVDYVEGFQQVLKDSDLIIGNCGLNTVSEILGSRKPFLSIAEERPFDEQYNMMKFLVQYDLSVNLMDAYGMTDQEILQKGTINPEFLNPQAPAQLLNWLDKQAYHPRNIVQNLRERNTQTSKKIINEI
ncbi:glycosyltransferase [Litoribacter populi]|uniref:glycosyltransferase n=1 Tax=Litoribacter populi TaxID=2598460 RepID=UPI0011806277|nr:glycosyltransferase [Litoribacter populi]